MEEIDLKELFLMFWKRKAEIILIIAIFIVIGFIYTSVFTKPMYTSSTTLVLAGTNDEANEGETSITTSDLTLNSKLVSTYSQLVKSNKVVRQVISNLGIDIPEEELRDNISVSSVSDTELIKITVTTDNSKYSADIANFVAKR